ncbi:MAG: hypothetical protein HOA38_08870, partial [Candidatus Marinimicrobia bacterium]|nr:hypothetical protein [Candidatus Neomarinimicrobiota bacterium]
GFFTGGIELGHKIKLGSGLSLDGGMFVGGGGGGSAPQGGGLMLRPHISLTKKVAGVNLGLGMSKINFPNGDIDSSQLGVQLDIPFGFIYKDFNSQKTNNNDVLTLDSNTDLRIGWQDHYMAPTYQHYALDSGVKNTGGTVMANGMDLVGFEYGTKLGNSYYYLETAGAGSKGTDGFAELLGGLGYSKDFGHNFGFNIKAALGAAGGGGVDTGGGLIHKKSIGMYIAGFNDMSLSAEIGRVGAFDGEFKADTFKLGLQYPFKLLSAGDNVRKSSNYDYTDSGLWGVRAAHQTYIGSDTLRKNSDKNPVQLLGIKLDRYLDDDTYLTGQALAAYKGEAGGYAVGLVGIGQELNVTKKLSLFAELGIGVAGGGGINTGDGLIMQPSIGLNYKLDSGLSFQSSAGKMQSINNGGDTNVLEFGLQYQFGTVE